MRSRRRQSPVQSTNKPRLSAAACPPRTASGLCFAQAKQATQRLVHCAFVGKCPRYLRVENYDIALLGCSLCVLTAHESTEIGALVLRSEVVAALSFSLLHRWFALRQSPAPR